KDVYPDEIDDEMLGEFSKSLFDCTCCGRCQEICSSDVSVLDLYKSLRSRVVEDIPSLEKIEENICEQNNIFGLENEWRLETLEMSFEGKVPNLNDRFYKEGKKAKVIFFLGCLMNLRSSQAKILEAIFQIFEILEIDYLILGGEEFCCGHPLDLLGETEKVSSLREHNNEIFRKIGAEIIVTDCPGCLEALHEFHEVGENVRILHLTELLDERIEEVPNPLDITLKYHDPCELFRNNKVLEAPRSLLKKIGVKVVEMEPSCCGGGGVLRVSNEDLAKEIMDQRKEKEKLENEPIDVVTCCPSCYEQYQQNGITTWDIAQWVLKALKEPTGGETEE
ncbi:MAG: (Fe-S)-binding protein, partial [Promethearchaeota archaeon]